MPFDEACLKTTELIRLKLVDDILKFILTFSAHEGGGNGGIEMDQKLTCVGEEVCENQGYESVAAKRVGAGGGEKKRKLKDLHKVAKMALMITRLANNFSEDS